LALSRQGLERRNRLDRSGRNETIYLEPLEALVAAGETQAEQLLRRYRHEWHGSVEPVFEALAY
ncbi:MAG: glutamate--cysteine ligase, partial [Methylobacterium sp.]|nr:glutamate--cysteine ligase [Methylobacterium sp.]